MKKFIDKTNSLKEPAVKTGNFVPRDAVNLGWFSSKDISPENNMIITDLSSLTPENVNPTEVQTRLMFANQLGILEDENGFSDIDSDEIYLSNSFIDKRTSSTNYSLESLNNQYYAMSYYPSRHFTLAGGFISVQSGLNSFTEQMYVPNNIQVFDSNNEHYIDKETGRKKYRIELENFITPFNNSLNEIPSKILVFLEDPNPINFTLQYDKVECDQNGKWSKQVLKYSETINPLPLFNQVQEESEVIDPFNSDRDVFSVKRSSKEGSIKRSLYGDNSNQIFVNKKAVDDNRNFQLFNWRLIGRIKSSVNLNEINYGNVFRNGQTNEVKVGVLYSSAHFNVTDLEQDTTFYREMLKKINAYVFYNLENSPLNLNGFTFINPNSTTTNKNAAAYWLVDIDTVTESEIQSYDSIVCSLSWNLTAPQAEKINRFNESYGSILFDVSQASSVSLLQLDSNFTISAPASVSPASIIQLYNADNNFINKNSTNAFDITVSEFAEDCGIYGYSKNINDTYKSYPFFSNNLNSVLKINGNNVIASKRIINPGSSHKASNIVMSTAEILKYANSTYLSSSNISNPNIGLTSVPISETIVSSYSDGPLKFLYNFVSVSLNDKLESNRISQNLNSTIHYFNTLWRNDWTLDVDALFDDEKEEYFTNQIVGNEQKLVKKVLNNPKLNYIEELQSVIPGIREAFLDQNNNNIDLFIEYTNPNVAWTNSSEITSEDAQDLASSYNVVKVVNKTASCNTYSLVKSNPFILPSDYGLHVIKNKPESFSSNRFTVRRSSQIKNYTFDLSLYHKKVVLADAPKYFDAQVNLSVKATFDQKRKVAKVKDVYDNGTPYVPAQPGSDVPLVITSVSTSQETLDGLLRNIKNPLNAFAYTGDIDQGNVSTSFSTGSTGDYVRYIQFTLSCAGFKTNIDSSFGAETANNVKLFQTDRGIKSDGIVDSQTKSYLGLFWSDLYNNNREDYNEKFALVSNENVKKYINAAKESELASTSFSKGKSIKAINFTGVSKVRDPEQIHLWVSFLIPSADQYKQLNSITITPDSFSSSASSYNGIQILDYRFDDQPTFQSSRNILIDRSDKTAELVIQVNNGNVLGKYVSIKIKGSPLGGSFGSKAEGLAIKQISCSLRTKDTLEVQPIEPKIIGKTTVLEEQIVKVDGVVDLTLPVNNLSASNKVFSIKKEELLQYGKLKSITIYENQSTENPSSQQELPYINLTNVSLNQSSYSPGESLGRLEVVDLSNPINISINTLSLVSNSIKESGSTSTVYYPNNFIAIQGPVQDNIFYCKATSTAYPSSNNYIREEVISNYKLKSAITGEIKSGSNTINFYDGPMLICNPDGSPYTMNISLISNQIASTDSVYSSDLEIIPNNVIDSGLKIGFYNLLTNQFLGTKISYYSYISNAANIYVAVYAYDYDGNLETISDSTSLDQDVITPALVPIKTAYPVYLVKTSNTNKIQLMQTQKNLDKTEPWPLMITSGSFYKNITIPSDFRSKDWVSKYLNQQLIAKYDTSSSESAAPSKIFGKKYYDVVDETPDIIDRYSIQTKQTPIHYIHEVSSDLSRFVAPINPIVRIYIREDINSLWQEVSRSKIKDINCKTGVIKFTDPIISSDENLTKISYTIKMNSIMFKHSNGTPIPTNPFLNKDTIKINKPLYVYLMPKEMYKTSANSQNLDPNASKEVEIVKEYNPQSLVNFTYDNNIFNKLDIYNYNPFALLIGIVYTINNFNDEDFTFTDLRVKGGGVSANFDTNQVLSDIKEAISYWDVYPPMAEAYPKGGYVIVRVPSYVKKNFTNPDKVYNIVRDNITAGVVFELQDMNGKDWGSSATVSS